MSLLASKCYKEIEKLSKSETFKDPQENWLEELVTMCSTGLDEAAKSALRDNFHRHVNPTYSLHSELESGLKLVFHLLKSSKDDFTAAIVAKLIEGVDACTPGFHIRLNEILQGFDVPQSLDDLFQQLREQIVLVVASKGSNDVHRHNRVYYVANKLNYGIKSLNSNDPYASPERDESIAQLLRTAFAANFTIPNILDALIENIAGQLRYQYDYTGMKPEGYACGQYDGFVGYLKKILNLKDDIVITDENYRDFLIFDEETYCISDVNWKKIRQELLQALLRREYFQEEGQMIPDILSLVTKEGLVHNPKELCSLFKYLDYTCSEDKLYSKEQLALVNTYCDTNQKKTSEALIFAAQNGHLEIVKELIVEALLAIDAKVDSANKNGATALIFAAQNGHLPIVEALLEKGAKVDSANKNSATALIFAAQNGHLPIVEALLEKGAKVDSANKNGNTALMLAAQNGRLEIVKELLAKDAKVDSVNKNGDTALIFAAEKGRLEIVMALLEKGAQVDSVNKNGDTALIFAAQNRHLAIVKALENNLKKQALIKTPIHK